MLSGGIAMEEKGLRRVRSLWGGVRMRSGETGVVSIRGRALGPSSCVGIKVWRQPGELHDSVESAAPALRHPA